MQGALWASPVLGCRTEESQLLENCWRKQHASPATNDRPSVATKEDEQAVSDVLMGPVMPKI